MKILVINAGSSSLKYQLIDMDDESVLAKGNCERIGMEDGIFTHKTNDGREKHVTVSMPDHTAAFTQVKNALIDPEVGVLKSLDEVSAVGHRIVQGGALFSKSVLVDDKVIEGIESLIPLAPLHNKAHVQGIRACIEVFGKSVPEVVVFDTAFHSTMPPKHTCIPFLMNIMKSTRFAVTASTEPLTAMSATAARELMGQDLKDLKMITCHLGNGSSISAIQDGKVIDTSMGLTPLDGFMMGSRTGTLDPSVVTFVMEKENITPHDMSEMLNKKIWYAGHFRRFQRRPRCDESRPGGKSQSDFGSRDAGIRDHENFIGAYAAALNGCDVIVFTAGREKTRLITAR